MRCGRHKITMNRLRVTRESLFRSQSSYKRIVTFQSCTLGPKKVEERWMHCLCCKTTKTRLNGILYPETPSRCLKPSRRLLREVSVKLDFPRGQKEKLDFFFRVKKVPFPVINFFVFLSLEEKSKAFSFRCSRKGII